MKKLVSNYSFNAAAKQITLADYTALDLESILLITNVATNTIIYNFAGQGKGATVSGNILTLDFDTTLMSDTDELQIFIDDGFSPAANATIEELTKALEDNNFFLRRILQALTPVANMDAAQRLRVTVDAITVGLGGTSNINTASVGGQSFGATEVLLQDSFNTYANCTRRHLIN
jgi:hypothetical protein